MRKKAANLDESYVCKVVQISSVNGITGIQSRKDFCGTCKLLVLMDKLRSTASWRPQEKCHGVAFWYELEVDTL